MGRNLYAIILTVCIPNVTHDVISIINEKLSGFGGNLYNSDHSGKGAAMGEMLPEYGNITVEQFKKIKYILANDLQPFGWGGYRIWNQGRDL